MLINLPIVSTIIFVFFFFNDTATTEIYTLSLHDALPILRASARLDHDRSRRCAGLPARIPSPERSEEHTSELQSQSNLVCRLLLEKKKTKRNHLAPSRLYAHGASSSHYLYTTTCTLHIRG